MATKTDTTTHTTTHTNTLILARRTMLAAAVGALCVGTAVGTRNASALSPVSPQNNPLVTLRVVDRETGEVARVWRHAGKLYVAGQPGARYSVRVTNNSGGRVLAVVSVDGVNVVSGQTAAYNQRGYVLAPYESYDINGWRKSDDEVAAFNFAPLAGSYAARTGRPDNVGVIGVAAFRERYSPPFAVSPSVSRESRDDASARAKSSPVFAPPMPVAPQAERRVMAPPPPPPPAAAPSGMARAESYAAAPAPSAKLGTGHGAREWSSVTNVSFERASAAPTYVYRVEYDSRSRLIASGVIPRPLPGRPGPTPFPGSGGYVPDPPYGG